MEATNVSFTAKDVMALRQKTGLGMMDCKKALEATNGDAKAAEEWLREKRKGKMDQRTERTTGEGRVEIVVSGDKAVIVEVRTETDFTARNDAFVQMVQDIANEAVSQSAGDVALSDAMTKRIDDLRITTGENVNFARGTVLQGGTYGSYVHFDGKRAALVQVDGTADDDLLKGICQHIVFHDPMGIDENDVPGEQTDRIRADAVREAEAAGKNAEIAQKIADGKVRKHLEENTLLHQKFVLDESKTVKEVLPKGAKIVKFIRYTLGTD